MHPKIYWILAGGIFLVSLIDWFVFAMHPLEKNIFIDQDMYQEQTKMTRAATKFMKRASVGVMNTLK